MANDIKSFDFSRLPSLMIKYLDKQNAMLSAFFKSPNKADLEKDMALTIDNAVSQLKGMTAFMISWVNPDEHHASKTFENYVLEGHIQILDVIKNITTCPNVSEIGYCTGGTLLATTAAYLAARGEDRFAALTYMATLIDFSCPGEQWNRYKNRKAYHL